MKLLFVFCCLSAGCVLWAEASPFFFNVPRTVITRAPAIRRRPVAAAAAGTSFGLGGLISKWFPNISINKQIGTRRPKPTQRPVIEVTTIFEPSEVEAESSSKSPAESIDNISEPSSTSYESSSVGEIEENSSSLSTTDESIVEKTSTTTTTTTTTTTPLPFEEIEPFTESKTTTSTTELPFEETEPNSSTTSRVPEQSTSTTKTTESTVKETEVSNASTVSTTTTTTTTEAYNPITEVKTSTTTGSPFTENESSTTTTTTNEAYKPITEVKTSTTTGSPFTENESSTTTTEAYKPITEVKTSTTTGSPFIENESSTTTTEAYKPITEVKTSTTTGSPFIENESSTKTTTTTQSFINEIGFTTEQNIPSTSTQVNKPNSGWWIEGTDEEEIPSPKPTTYRPSYVPTTTSTTNPPWKETPTDIINTGGIVNPNKPPESYFYVVPDVSADDILFNEISSKARPFGSQSVIGTTSNNDRVARTNSPENLNSGEINDRPRVTFFSNYFTY